LGLLRRRPLFSKHVVGFKLLSLS